MKFEYENVKQVGFSLAVVGAFFTTQVHADPPGQVNVTRNSLSNSAAPQEAIDDAVEGTVIRVNGDCEGINYVITTDGLTLSPQMVSLCAAKAGQQ